MPIGADEAKQEKTKPKTKNGKKTAKLYPLFQPITCFIYLNSRYAYRILSASGGSGCPVRALDARSTALHLPLPLLLHRTACRYAHFYHFEAPSGKSPFILARVRVRAARRYPDHHPCPHIFGAQ